MITVLMLPNLSKIGILIDFKINQDFIANILCINRKKPKSTCNGKCYLSEQLKKVEGQEEKQAPTNKKEQLEVIYFCSKSSFNFFFFTDCFASKLNVTCVDNLHASSFISDIFRPPKLNLI